MHLTIHEKGIIFSVTYGKNAWIVDIENMSIFEFILNDDFIAFIVLFGKLMQNIFDKKWF